MKDVGKRSESKDQISPVLPPVCTGPQAASGLFAAWRPHNSYSTIAERKALRTSQVILGGQPQQSKDLYLLIINLHYIYFYYALPGDWTPGTWLKVLSATDPATVGYEEDL